MPLQLPEQAVARAGAARDLFRAQGRARWQARASFVLLRAGSATGDHDGRLRSAAQPAPLLVEPRSPNSASIPARWVRARRPTDGELFAVTAVGGAQPPLASSPARAAPALRQAVR
ncbi:hypothetical protein DFJ67_2704 [Asanoa ferruginea]|uniref:Uncharacterized protein n=1 Tax=Asanoa ferruginea TaxID=53367 RepID=A0A3D9ZLA3_9ACTN|nr:hypothetical protein [Asanoa ferruginea]REF96713.1 hypothetical protein DFJ67_2704 [Asanoa ferruginea]GIF48904.1 hypothetical protein Afe04nite_34430 [Asanoa ferruginea]